jgi:hypothetical protein
MSTTPAEPRHGQTRNRGQRTPPSAPVGFFGPEGEFVLVAPVCALTESTCERYCEVCQAWVPCAGLLETLACKECKTPWSAELRGCAPRSRAAAAGGSR